MKKYFIVIFFALLVLFFVLYELAIYPLRSEDVIQESQGCGRWMEVSWKGWQDEDNGEIVASFCTFGKSLGDVKCPDSVWVQCSSDSTSVDVDTGYILLPLIPSHFIIPMGSTYYKIEIKFLEERGRRKSDESLSSET